MTQNLFNLSRKNQEGDKRNCLCLQRPCIKCYSFYCQKPGTNGEKDGKKVKKMHSFFRDSGMGRLSIVFAPLHQRFNSFPNDIFAD